MPISNTQKTIVLLVVITLIAVGVLGIGMSNFRMTADASGQMSSCPFMGFTSVCKMNSFEHINAWRSIFTALPFKEISALALLLLAVFSVFLRRDFWNTKWAQSASGYIRHLRSGTFVMRNKLQEALSSGVLHPKIF